MRRRVGFVLAGAAALAVAFLVVAEPRDRLLRAVRESPSAEAPPGDRAVDTPPPAYDSDFDLLEFLRGSESVALRPVERDSTPGELDPVYSLTLAGRVIDSEGRPVESAKVDADFEGTPPHGFWGRATVTERDGRFLLKELPPGSLRLTVSVGYWWRSDRSVTRAHVAAGSDLEVRLPFPVEPRPVVRVRAHLPDGSPLPHGTIWSYSCGPAQKDPLMDGEGSAELDARLPAGECLPWLLVADDSRQYAPVKLRDVPLTGQPVDIDLKPALTVEGHVVADGVPLAVEVAAAPDDVPWYAVPNRVRAGEDGRFRIDGLPPGLLILSAVEDDYYGGNWGHTDKAYVAGWVRTQAGARNVVLRLEPPAAIRGRVATDDPRSLYLTARLGGSDVAGAYVADDGSFSINGLVPGQAYGLRAAGWEFVEGESVPVEAPAEGIELRLRPGLSIEGRVLREDGSPCAGAPVEAEPLPRDSCLAGRNTFSSRSETDQEGRFLLTRVLPGPCVLKVWRRLEAVVEGGARDVVVTAHECGVLSGRVKNPTPFLDGFVVEAWSALPGFPPVEPAATGRVSADGFFRVGVPLGTYRLVIWSDEGTDDDRYCMTLAKTGTAIELELETGERVWGVTRNSTGEPAGYETLLVSTNYGHREVRADWDGRFVIPGLPAGQYELRARGITSLTVNTGAEITVTVPK